LLNNLSILPTCGAQFFQHQGSWQELYSEDFTPGEKQKIIASLQQTIVSSGCRADRVWGDVIEDRGSQITFSGLGQQAPLEAKKLWDPDFSRRTRLQAALEALIPEFSVQLGGATSVDITRPGIDKAYGIHKLRDILHIPIEAMIFVGDALFPGGNDYPAKAAGALCIQVKDPHETKRVIEAIVGCLGQG
jgi:phosphomannomutase